MATIKQIDANRQNAQRSSGPRSPEGKAASRFNALKSGIDAQAQVIPGEDPAQLEALLAEYQERFDTSVPERRMLVDTLVACDWLFRRLNRAEASGTARNAGCWGRFALYSPPHLCLGLTRSVAIETPVGTPTDPALRASRRDVYSAEMEKDVSKAIEAVRRRITALEQPHPLGQVPEGERPSGNRLLRFLKGWQETIYFGFVIVIGAWVLNFHLPALIDSAIANRTGTTVTDVATLKADVGNIKESVSRIDRNIENLLGKAIDTVLKDSKAGASGARTAKDMAFARELIQMAQETHVHIDPSIISAMGASLLRENRNLPKADHSTWMATIDVLNYKSYLNQASFNVPSEPNAVLYTKYALHTVPGMADPHFRASGIVEKKDAAVLQLIDQPTNPTLTKGNGLLIGQGGAMSLDNMEARHIVFVDVEIHYTGALIKLSDIVFLNCKFVIDDNRQGEQLAQAILQSARVSVELSS